jgi:hypothetical protein
MIMYDNQFLRLFESPIVVGFFIMTACSLLWPFFGPVVKAAVSHLRDRGTSS